MRSELRALALAALALVGGCGEPTANADVPAYAPTYAIDGRTVLYHWRAGATIHVFAQPDLDLGIAGLSDALQNAFETWRTVPEFREFRLVLVDRATDADVIVRLRSNTPLVRYADCDYPSSAASGVTFFCPDANLAIVQTLPLVAGENDGHVKMEVAVDRFAGDFQAVVTHEIGHVLGIGAHSLDRADLMYPFPIVDTPSARDVATLRYVLHQRSALVL